MGALPQPTLKLDQYGRDPGSPAEKLRRRTNYTKGTGWAPFYLAFMADMPRLASGEKACLCLMLAILTESLGRFHEPKDPHQEWTEGHELEYWASLCCCDVRTVQRVRDYLASRKIAEVAVDTKRRYSFRLRFREWQGIEDYATWKARQKPEDSTDDPEPEDPSAPDMKINAGTVRILKAPAKVKAGKTSKAWPVNCGVKSVSVCNPNSVDIRYDAVVQAGRLLITPLVLERRSKGESVQKAKSVANKDTSLNRGRQPRRPDAFSSPHKRGDVLPANVGRKPVEHPRAVELCELFDPLLLHSCHKSLSADPVALAEACKAVGSTDHDFLVKWVIERFERPVKAPKHCKAILLECRVNWEKVKDLPVPLRKPPQSAKPGFTERLKTEAARRLAKYGHI